MNPLEFNKDIGEMSDAEARATLRDVRSKYNDAKDEYESLQTDVEEYEDKLEEKDDELDQFKEAAAEAHDFFAGKAAEVKDMDSETIKEKFSTSEIKEELLDDAEFYIGSPEDDEDDSTFQDNPEQSDNLGGGSEDAWYEQEAAQAVESITVQHDEI